MFNDSIQADNFKCTFNPGEHIGNISFGDKKYTVYLASAEAHSVNVGTGDRKLIHEFRLVEV